MNKVFLLLGANLGDPALQISKAIAALENQVGSIVLSSSLYESAAWGQTDQPAFLNQVVILKTALSALGVLEAIQKIEQDLGRVRTLKWGARIIDIDILYFNDETIDLAQLSVPHPYIPERKFTLLPLVEIAASHKHPVLALDQLELLTACTDTLSVIKYTAKP
ncbi:2-amino-4-hydroxy-6-hydroxymethyldihydropteridine diphosphokinase [Sphingobacterium oryzagri]|uniref:2-amino-4-hydroxy-6-hydroxymethyldihydropteridine pyrophosphokinase n=1 Tax=Sphingobacterium oryzagri TaxID=3025669 RepID=A0ABY7WE18_9SPHI|nr:2-amino-4-hydroxy-6-hydroxymethyldihydropteridine diphosphokinase [Sphingobacterium sp. KACC 22765]WDF67730.1 2-amino-4-hydroxy-6-hydroxymethyldihydropteridine diphosphokinase [Sphingobacterium sp. KACC 22765]